MTGFAAVALVGSGFEDFGRLLTARVQVRVRLGQPPQGSGELLGAKRLTLPPPLPVIRRDLSAGLAWVRVDLPVLSRSLFERARAGVRLGHGTNSPDSLPLSL